MNVLSGIAERPILPPCVGASVASISTKQTSHKEPGSTCKAHTWLCYSMVD